MVVLHCCLLGTIEFWFLILQKYILECIHSYQTNARFDLNRSIDAPSILFAHSEFIASTIIMTLCELEGRARGELILICAAVEFLPFAIPAPRPRPLETCICLKNQNWQDDKSIFNAHFCLRPFGPSKPRRRFGGLWRFRQFASLESRSF